MPRGGHSRSGPIVKDDAARALSGSRERAQHRTKGKPGVAIANCDPPPGLTPAERASWSYYAADLVARGLFTVGVRDTLAKYCTALAQVAELKKSIASRGRINLEQRVTNRKELRQWLNVSRLYENDLLLNPASAMRAPSAAPDPEPDLWSEFESDEATAKPVQ